MDSIQAQLQIRQNAMEAQEYAQDLLSWQTAIKAKAGNSSKQQQQQPRQMPVRGRASGSVAAAPQAPQQPLQDSKQAHPAAHTYKNYEKWDKFDVYAALAATEAAEQQQQQPALHGPAAPPAQQQQQPGENMMEPRVANAPAAPQTPAGKAAALKDQGNQLFQAQYYDDAISCYSQSIDAHPTAVAYANRAMAFLKLAKPLEAEADCAAALQLDPSYVKAWHRRGTARRQLGKLVEAAADFEEVLRLEPSNAPVQADRNSVLDQHLKQAQIQRSTAWHSIPVKRQQQQQQQAAAGGVQPVQPLQEVGADSNQQQQQGTQQGKQQGGATVPAPNGVARPVMPVSAPGSRSSSAHASPQQRQSVAAAAQAAAEQLAARLGSSLKAPKTGHEFESAWRSLKGDVQLQVCAHVHVTAPGMHVEVRTAPSPVCC